MQPWEPTLFKEPAQPSVPAPAILAEWKSPVAEAPGTCWAAEPSPGSIPEPLEGPCSILELRLCTLHRHTCTGKCGMRESELEGPWDHKAQGLHLCGDEPGSERAGRAGAGSWGGGEGV